MVILRKNYETREIEIPGFRKILNNPKHPDYRELKMYIKKGWIPVDTEDDAKELQKAKKKKQVAKRNKELKPSYVEMERNLTNLTNNNKLDKKELDNFKQKKDIKYNYQNVLNWYNDIMKTIPNEIDATSKKDTTATKSDKK